MSRLIGLLIVFAGVAVGWFTIAEPLQQAHAHAANVQTSIKAFVFAPLAVVSGFALLIGGGRVAPIFAGAPRGKAQTTLAIVIMVIAFSATGIGWWLFKAQLASLGYGS